jgi:hypothetical protein
VDGYHYDYADGARAPPDPSADHLFMPTWINALCELISAEDPWSRRVSANSSSGVTLVGSATRLQARVAWSLG